MHSTETSNEMSTSEISTFGVVGLGLLGRGIAACLLSRGFRVIAVVPSPEEHSVAWQQIESMLDELVDLDGLELDVRNSAASRMVPCTDVESMHDVRFVIESVTEDMAIKQSVFDELERVVSDSTIIASNTSAIPISLLQQTRRRPERFLGMHWAVPAHSTRFLELIRGEATSDAALQIASDLAKQLGKDPAVCLRDVPGFIVNRIAYAMYREALHLVETGVADVETIDRSLRNTFGLWAASCGPFRWIDLTGGPALYARAMERVLPTLSSATTIPAPLADLANANATGSNSGAGFYDYSPEEARVWEMRQRRYTWQVKKWLDEEFPLTSKPEEPQA